ncbi:MAG: hypothetical protein JNM27_09690 [Leptospirales bacterium]|nr:hypothetical protein [Leptospirales bacterium]
MIFRLAGALFVLLPLQLRADIVVMRDGTVHRGSVIKQDAGGMEVRTKDGTVELEKPFIYRIFYDEAQYRVFEQREGPRMAEMRALSAAWQKKIEESEKEHKETLESERTEHERVVGELKSRYTTELGTARQNARAELRSDLWHNAVFPGWTEYRRREFRKSAVFSAGAVLALFNLRRSYSALYQSKREYADPGMPAVYSQFGAAGLALNYIYFEEKTAHIRRKQSAVNLAWLIVGATWTAGLVDAAVAPEAVPSSETGQINLSWTMRF